MFQLHPGTREVVSTYYGQRWFSQLATTQCRAEVAFIAQLMLMACSFTISPDVSKPLAVHTRLKQRCPPGPRPPFLLRSLVLGSSK